MSEQNVELHRHALEAFNARDIEAFIALTAPQIEFHSAITAPVGGGVYHGHDGVRRWHREFEDVWGDQIRLEPEAFFDLGEQTLAFGVLHGRGRQSGADVAVPAAQVCTWRDGLLVYYKGYVHRQDALTDLGISEQALEPTPP